MTLCRESRRMRGVLGWRIGVEHLTDLAGQVVPAGDAARSSWSQQTEDHFHARQIDAQVAVKAHDRPDPPHLGRFVPLLGPVMSDLDQSKLLVTDQGPGETPVARATSCGESGIESHKLIENA